ncbi:MAG: hypothetical protein LBL15_04270 [Oscillospiraceae bacterium]|jgi:hypothetical protein|nr:hypothetical protein [Oscillospiraceae bacterium]
MAMYPNRICRQCGRSFAGGPRAWYCPDCRSERQKKQRKEHKRRAKLGQARKLGETISSCEICGKPYIVSGALQRSCPVCAPAAVAEIDREQGLEYYADRKEAINPARYAALRKTTACVVCGKEFPANGKRTNTCSGACHKIKMQRLFKIADAKRAPRHRGKPGDST